MARVVLIRHGDDPDDDRAVTFFRYNGIEPEIVRPFKGEQLGDVDDNVIGTVIYGGPFNVFEEHKHPFLHDENRWISQCLAKGVPMLGICQGAQSIAHVMGAPVGPQPGDPGEFGYYEINPSPSGKAFFPDSLFVTEAHFHEFAIPAGADRLAGSAQFPNQACRFAPNAFGFQFHPEVTPPIFRRWQEAEWGHKLNGAQPVEQQNELMARHDRAMHLWFMGFMDRLFGPAIAKAFDGQTQGVNLPFGKVTSGV